MGREAPVVGEVKLFMWVIGHVREGEFRRVCSVREGRLSISFSCLENMEMRTTENSELKEALLAKPSPVCFDLYKAWLFLWWVFSFQEIYE